MSDKLPDDKDVLIEFLKKFGAPIGGFIGAITLAYNFYKMWSGDQKTVTYIIAGAAVIVVLTVLGWIGFSQKTVIHKKKPRNEPRYPLAYRQIALALLGLVFIGSGVSGWLLYKNRISQLKISENKIIILVTQFDGPENKYGIRDELIEKLKEATKDYSNIEINTVETSVNSTQGSEYARNLGKKGLADIVIWAWYRPTENPNITIHIENLSPNDFSLIKESEVYRPSATIADLESFEIQKQIGAETGNLVNFLAGYLQYQTKEYLIALEHFEFVINSKEDVPLINEKYLFLFSGLSNYHLKRYDGAVRDYSQAIQIDLNFADAYNNRGVVYDELSRTSLAIQDYTKAIQIDPNSAAFYYNRAGSNSLLKNYNQVVADLNQVIQINPNHYYAYRNRGATYNELQEFDLAIQDLDKAIYIDPNDSDAYSNRGFSYNNLNQPTKAIQDLDKAIQIDPNNASAYSNRGDSYNKLGQYERAIQDLNQAIQIDQNLASAYTGLGYSNFMLGKYESAILYLSHAIKINPESYDAFLGRGSAYQKLEKNAEAESDFKKYEELTSQKP
jgi:tetratricopeptide (TPR) repeat protein